MSPQHRAGVRGSFFSLFLRPSSRLRRATPFMPRSSRKQLICPKRQNRKITLLLSTLPNHGRGFATKKRWPCLLPARATARTRFPRGATSSRGGSGKAGKWSRAPVALYFLEQGGEAA